VSVFAQSSGKMSRFSGHLFALFGYLFFFSGERGGFLRIMIYVFSVKKTLIYLSLIQGDKKS
jgi:hypothetical protein